MRLRDTSMDLARGRSVAEESQNAVISAAVRIFCREGFGLEMVLLKPNERGALGRQRFEVLSGERGGRRVHQRRYGERGGRVVGHGDGEVDLLSISMAVLVVAVASYLGGDER